MLNIEGDLQQSHHHNGINIEVDCLVSIGFGPISGHQNEEGYHDGDQYAETYGKSRVIHLL